ncbi:branched-chain amino acid ABC transporter permease [Halorubellus sp. JP-L1]|uniref:branched-chain amino acid ABC transporter permease n=1 Tax=Halorubellus sp. JP-L1 TaxID=2715753 RepID=UPI0014074D26|nr:branched-chain amino acid ABC transporter permease [Halorubellus sp. JP-L1]NHN40948.1 branched-chain amino acid ABC transporter permease [Halorubellus sp. JP-L1]
MTDHNPEADAATADATSTDAGTSGATDSARDRAVGESALDVFPDWVGRYRVPIGLVLFVLLLRPVVALPFMLGFESIASTILILVLFVAAFNLLFGYTGLLSFGHAMFFGFGMYGAAIAMSGHGPAPELPFLVGATVGVAIAALVGYGLGRLTVGKGEIYFAFLTLAAAEAVYFVANRDPLGLTGGSDGISGGAQPGWVESFRGELTVTLVEWPDPILEVAGWLDDWYLLVGIVFLLGMGALWQIVRSPFGRSLIAIRENENLARAMGIDTARYKVWAFTFSGAFSAVAGALMAINNHGASQEWLGVYTSGDTVLMAVLGGVHYFFGAVAGVFVWEFVADYLTDFAVIDLGFVAFDVSRELSHWQFLLGAVFVVIVLVSPNDGIWGYVRAYVGRATRRVLEVVR